jgi:hypothetical protein
LREANAAQREVPQTKQWRRFRFLEQFQPAIPQNEESTTAGSQPVADRVTGASAS